MFNCTSEPFLELRGQLSQMEKQELGLNSFVSVKLATNLQEACEEVGMETPSVEKKKDTMKDLKFESRYSRPKESLWSESFAMDYLTDEFRFHHDRLYGADLLVTEGILHELIGFELMQNGLNLSHSQDKYFIKNLVESASVILDKKYRSEWERLSKLTQRGTNDLVDAFNKYMVILARSQHDTYTNPFEIVHDNMALGLDIVTAESLFGYEPQQLSDYHMQLKRNGQESRIKTNQFTTESVILPDTSSFLQHSSKQKTPLLSFPKYNNYLQDRRKFDKSSRFMIPLDLLGIMPPGKNEVTHTSSDYRAIIAYAQYKDAGALFPANFDDTITKRWGVDVQIASPILTLAVFVPSVKDSEKENFKMDRQRTAEAEQVFKTDSSNAKTKENIQIVAHENIEDDKHIVDLGDIHVHLVSENPSDDNFTMDLRSTTESHAEMFEGNDRDDQDRSFSEEHSIKKRSATENVSGEAKKPDSLVYRSLGSPHLTQPIKIQMCLNLEGTHFGIRSNPQCVRWNTFSNSWTRLGCQTEAPDFETLDLSKPILINCTCSHVSNYAVLVDIIDPEDIPEPSLLVQISSYSAFMLSLPILFGVLIALALLRGMQTNSNTIHQNLVLCVFVAELLFFVSMQARRELLNDEFSCKMIAICLHYAWLAAFAWTTVDCMHLYRMLTEMRDINHGPMGFYFSMGYGAPAIIVGLSVGVRAHEYGNSLL